MRKQKSPLRKQKKSNEKTEKVQLENRKSPMRKQKKSNEKTMNKKGREAKHNVNKSRKTKTSRYLNLHDFTLTMQLLQQVL